MRAAACMSLNWLSVTAAVGLTSKAKVVAAGTNSCSTSSRFGPSSTFKRGHAREIAARSVQAGDKSELDRVAGAPEDDRNRRGCRLCRPCRAKWHRAWQSRSPGGEPDRPRAPASDRIGSPPSDIRSPRCGPRHSRLRSGLGGTRAQAARARPRGPLMRYPITGIAGCCARGERPRRRRAAEKRDEIASPHGLPSVGQRPHLTTALRASCVVHHRTAPAVQEESDYQRSVRVRSLSRRTPGTD